MSAEKGKSDSLLKPCPFCGGEVRLVDPNVGSGQKVAMTYPRYPFCDNCNVEFIFGSRSEHMMRTRFNQRNNQADKAGYLRALGGIEDVINRWQFKYDGQFYAVSRDILLEHIEKSRATGGGVNCQLLEV